MHHPQILPVAAVGRSCPPRVIGFSIAKVLQIQFFQAKTTPADGNSEYWVVPFDETNPTKCLLKFKDNNGGWPVTVASDGRHNMATDSGEHTGQ